jgi:hypothetical protein
MKSHTHSPGGGAGAAHRHELGYELQAQNERHARVGRLRPAGREPEITLTRLLDAQHADRCRLS